MKSCCGKILRVDLTQGKTWVESIPDAVYAEVLSGKGLGAWYLYKHIPADADPLGPDNILGFVSGALTGTGALICGRWMAVCKSPLTGGWGDANCGGTFSPAIKQCGYDAIFISGISPTPVYLWCDNRSSEIRDASAYWGLDATEAEIQLKQDTRIKKRPDVAVIGQAGEKVSLISGIVNDGGRIAARSGVGAVMGSKRLKAVVLAGTRPLPCADPQAVKQISQKFGMMLKKVEIPGFVKGSLFALGGMIMGSLPMTLPIDGAMTAGLMKMWGSSMNNTLGLTSGDTPIKNWAGTPRDARALTRTYNPDKLAKYETSKYHCYSCGLGCGGQLDISTIYGGEFNTTHKPEYETMAVFGPLLLNNDLESVLYINELLNRAGMDTISAGGTVAYAIECFEKGILTLDDTDGLELTWGNAEAIIALVRKMINREGIGDVLADGVKRAAQRLGGSEFAMHVGGQEAAMHDSRNDPQLAVHYVAEPAPGKHTVGMGMMYNAMSLADICSWAPPATMKNKAQDRQPNQTIALTSAANACYSMLVDGAGGCYYAEMLGVHAFRLVEYLNAAAGWDYDGDHYMEVGKRIQTLRQLFNVKHGVMPTTFQLPARMAGNPPLTNGPLKGARLNNEAQVSLHWQVLGWDSETGIPTADTLTQLGIPELLALGEAGA